MSCINSTLDAGEEDVEEENESGKGPRLTDKTQVLVNSIQFQFD